MVALPAVKRRRGTGDHGLRDSTPWLKPLGPSLTIRRIRGLRHRRVGCVYRSSVQVEVQPPACGAETDGSCELDRVRNFDGQLFHLIPVGAIPVVVAAAFADDEGNREAGVSGGADDHHLRLAMAAHDVRVAAGAAQRCGPDGRSSFDLYPAHG